MLGIELDYIELLLPIIRAVVVTSDTSDRFMFCLNGLTPWCSCWQENNRVDRYG